MSEAKPPLTLDLTWQGDLRFAGTSESAALVMDSSSQVGPSPVQTLAFALAGCMAMDVVHILTKGRARIDAMTARLVAHRAETQPRRIVSAEIHFALTGAMTPEQVERAIALSRAKYCSVWHSLRQDIVFTTSFVVGGRETPSQ
jgi:putative redox protein